jgi:hypothetical protein
MAAGVAWLAAWGVAVGSAKPPGSLQYLDPASYVAIGVVVVGFLVVVGVMYDWPARLLWLNPHPAGPPLKVESGKPHYHDWNIAASVAALPIKVTNKTREPVTLPGGCSCEIHGGDAPSWMSSLRGSGAELAFSSEVESQRRSSHHQPDIRERTTIPAHASLELWFVTGVGRDYRGLRPRMTVHFNDADGNKYAATFGGQEPRHPKKRASLTLRRNP